MSEVIDRKLTPSKKVILLQTALAQSIQENEQLRLRVAELEALMVESQLRQQHLQQTIKRLLVGDVKASRGRRVGVGRAALRTAREKDCKH